MMTPFGIIMLFGTVLIITLIIYDHLAFLFKRPPSLIFNGIFFLLVLICSICHAGFSKGWIWTLKFFAVTSLVPLLIETIGIHTGLPFGRYEYKPIMGPRLPLGVPAIVVLMWSGLLYVSTVFATAFSLVFGCDQHLLTFIGSASVFVIGFDLLADPIMVDNRGWVWKHQRQHFLWYGIPLENFVGWLFTSITTLLVVWTLANPFFEDSGQPYWLTYIIILWAGLMYLSYTRTFFARRWKTLGLLCVIQGVIILVVYGMVIFYI
jgi:uncharacterized membrane protein